MLTVSYAYSIRRTTGNVLYGQTLPADSPTQYLQMTSIWDPLIGTEKDELKHSRRTSPITGFVQGNLSKKSMNVTYSTAGWKQRNEHRMNTGITDIHIELKTATFFNVLISFTHTERLTEDISGARDSANGSATHPQRGLEQGITLEYISVN